MARYREIADDIRAKIKTGDYPKGSRLPSISVLMEEYKVDGLNTIRAAQQLLAEEGMVESRQGVGVFVTADVPATRAIDVPNAIAGARDTLTAVLAAMATQAKRTVSFELEDDAQFVLTEALREFAARERWLAKDADTDGSRIRWAERAEAMIELVEKAR